MVLWDLDHGINRTSGRIEIVSFDPQILVQFTTVLELTASPIVEPRLVRILIIGARVGRVDKHENERESSGKRKLQHACHVEHLIGNQGGKF